MRILAGLHVAAGVITLLAIFVLADGKNVGSEVAKSEANNNVIQKQQSFFSFIKSLIPAKAISEAITSVTATAATPQARSLNHGSQRKPSSRKQDASKNKRKEKKQPLPTPKITVKPKSRTIKPTTRQNNRHAEHFNMFPAPGDMEILTLDQKRNRLRQELVKETEGNCLAKILCGTQSKPKEKDQQNLATETAYLIREFFDIFDFSQNREKATDSKKKGQVSTKDEEKEDNDDKSEEDEDADDEVEDIYRDGAANQKVTKYTTNKPKKPAAPQLFRTSKPLAAPIATTTTSKRPKPVRTTTTTTTKKTTTTTKRPTTTTTTTTTTTPTPKVIEEDDDEVVTPSSHVITTTMMSTSMSGSATLHPLDVPWKIQLDTAKDDVDEDDDEEDDNVKYNDDGDNDSKFHRVTLEELVGDIKLSTDEMSMLRRGRSMKMPIDNVSPSKFIQSKIRQMKMAKSDSKKLQIASRIGRSFFREARQCRQFSQVAQEVLQTCPLTSEVIRFFNTNLRNGTQLEVKKVSPGVNSSGGGLVLLNNDVDGAQQAYFVDNSPQVANTKIIADLKNPSIPSTFDQDQVHYPVYEKRPNPNPQNAHLNQQGQDVRKRPSPSQEPATSKEDSDEDEQDDDDDDDEEEEDEEEEDYGRKDSNDNEEEDEEDDDDDEPEDDEEGEEDEETASEQPKKVVTKKPGAHKHIQGDETNQPNVKVVIKPRPPPRAPQKPTLPPGIIRVYGVPQTSFDKDFSLIADKIGPRPVTIFGEEDIDRPAYKRRRQLSARSSHKGKSDNDDGDDDDENVPFSSRIPKHPPLESQQFVHDGDDDDYDNKTPYQTHKKNANAHLGGKPLGGVKGAGDDDDDDDDDNDDKKKKHFHSSGNKKKNKNKDKDEDQSVEASSNPKFKPSMLYSVGVPPQQSYHHQQHHQQYFHNGQHHHGHRPYRPLVRPIQIMPDVSIPMAGMTFRPSPGREYIRPGRLYPLYHG